MGSEAAPTCDLDLNKNTPGQLGGGDERQRVDRERGIEFASCVFDQMNRIASLGEPELQWLICAFARVVVLELLAQTARFHEHDRVNLGIESAVALEDIHADRVFPEWLARSGQRVLDHVA